MSPKKFEIRVAFGEIIDKISILSIKLKKTNNNTQQRQNIENELDILFHYFTENKDDPKFIELYNMLYAINQKLWQCEDFIRYKSSMKEFDKKYIECAESIHRTNDLRFQTKRELNLLYNSDIIEEKIYVSRPEYDQDDQYILQHAQNLYQKGQFMKSLHLLNDLCKKSIKKPLTDFVGQVFTSYLVCTLSIGSQIAYEDVLNKLAQKAEIIFQQKDAFQHFCRMYSRYLLIKKDYSSATLYRKYEEPVFSSTNNINPDTMSYFRTNESNKVLLIYFAGGFGDKIMHARFIPNVSLLNPQHKILLLIDDSLLWMFSGFMENYKNLKCIPFSQRDLLPHFDYHTNITHLFMDLGLTYEDIYVDYYLNKIKTPTLVRNKLNYTQKTRKIVINWKGNSHGITDTREIPLSNFIPIFETIKDVQWVSVQKKITPVEKDILEKFDVFTDDTLDQNGNAFQDTLAIFRAVDLIITIDTSFAHLAGTDNLPCWVLLNKGNEWRWTYDEKTRWYPNLTLFRQDIYNDWSRTLEVVQKHLLNHFPPKKMSSSS